MNVEDYEARYQSLIGKYRVVKYGPDTFLLIVYQSLIGKYRACIAIWLFGYRQAMYQSLIGKYRVEDLVEQYFYTTISRGCQPPVFIYLAKYFVNIPNALLFCLFFPKIP